MPDVCIIIEEFNPSDLEANLLVYRDFTTEECEGDITIKYFDKFKKFYILLIVCKNPEIQWEFFSKLPNYN